MQEIRKKHCLLVSKLVVGVSMLLAVCGSAWGITSTVSPSDAYLSTLKGKHVRMTVFVHGMMNIKFHLTCKNVIGFMTDSVHNTIYEKTIDIMRQNPFFFTNQVMSYYGLRFIDQTGTATDEKSLRAIAYLFDQFDVPTDTHESSPINLYYTFGWSGLLSKKERMWSAYDLFVALEDEIVYLQKQGITPEIRIIGYSHGGSLSLCLAHVRATYFPQSLLKIHELVLLGTPIKKDIDYLVHDDLFVRVYNIYSLRDRVQGLDLISRNQLFSQHEFIPRVGFELPHKLTQIRIKVMRLRKHTCNEHERLVALAQQVENHRVQLGTARFLRDVSPGHMELWFFGWTPLHYRSHFPLYPFPVVTVIPYLINKTEQYQMQGCSYTMDIRPEMEYALLRHKKCSTKIDFFTRAAIQNIREQLDRFAPDTVMDGTEYVAHIKNAFAEARCLMEQENEYEKLSKQYYLQTRPSCCLHNNGTP